jgi:hypothetical protein
MPSNQSISQIPVATINYAYSNWSDKQDLAILPPGECHCSTKALKQLDCTPSLVTTTCGSHQHSISFVGVNFQIASKSMSNTC